MDPGDTVTVSYTKPATNPLQDAAGNETLSFTDFSVDNPIIGTIPLAYFTPTAGSGSVTLEWDRVGATPPVTKYQVFYYLSLVELVWVDVPGGAAARTYTVTGLEGGEAYAFGLRAVNDDGPGPSFFTSVTVLRPTVETPGGFTATGGFRKLDLSWTAAGSTVTVERYQYRLSTDGGDNWNLWNDIPRQRHFDHQLHHKRPSGRDQLHGRVAHALRSGERDRENEQPAERLQGPARRASRPQGDAIAQLSRGPVLVGPGIEWRQGDHEVRVPSKETEWILRFLVF